MPDKIALESRYSDEETKGKRRRIRSAGSRIYCPFARGAICLGGAQTQPVGREPFRVREGLPLLAALEQ